MKLQTLELVRLWQQDGSSRHLDLASLATEAVTSCMFESCLALLLASCTSCEVCACRPGCRCAAAQYLLQEQETCAMVQQSA